MNVYVVGVALHPPAFELRGLRLEEMAYHTAHAALAHAGVTRSRLDSLTIGACDEIDGRPISSMLMSAPAGGYGTDEIKVTDSGATALALALARFLAGESRLGLVTSWCKSSKTDVQAVMRLRAEPFYTRPLGVAGTVSDALFAQAVAAEFEVSDEEAAARATRAYARAARNPRGMRHAVPAASALAASPLLATPLREGHVAPLTDGAVALVLASEDFLRANREVKPLARIAGIGWATDAYRLDAMRLRSMTSARRAWQQALAQARLADAAALDVIELDTPTAWHEAAYVRAFGIEREGEVLTPSGGGFAQNPFFCSGLANAAEAVLQVAGQAGPVQRPRVRRAAAHACHGDAQQGNVVMVFEAPGGVQ